MLEERIYDSEGNITGTEEIVDFDTYYLSKTVQSMTLTVTDPFGKDHLAIKDAPFHDEGRGIYKRTEALTYHFDPEASKYPQ